MRRGEWLMAAALVSMGLAARAGPSASVAAAVADPARPATDKDRDSDRKPAEMLSFAGVKPGQTVVDFMPGGGYFTRLFASAVGAQGPGLCLHPPTEVAKFAKGGLPANGSSPDPARPNVTALVAPVADLRHADPG